MRVHPAPRGQSIALRYGGDASFEVAEAILDRQRKLRRLPHLFGKVLELPFRSDADVPVAEDNDCFRFVASASAVFEGAEVRAHAIQICPGVMKVVVRESNAADGDGGEEVEEDLGLDRWRFRLPPSTRPDLATAQYANGVLVVVVPKNRDSDDLAGDEEDGEGLHGDLVNNDVNRLVLVQ